MLIVGYTWRIFSKEVAFSGDGMQYPFCSNVNGVLLSIEGTTL